VSNESGNLREFVGFVWPDGDFSDQIGLLLLAVGATEAGIVAREAYGDGFRVSLWNEEDAAKPR
jgi:hypothetical protein